MKVASVELSRSLRKDVSLLEILNNISNILNLGRYQMRVVSTVPTHTGEDGEHLLYISGTVRRFYFYDTTNSTWQFIEWNVSGIGQATIVKTISLTGQLASIGATTLYTPAAAGLYRVSVYMVCSSAGSGGTLDATIGWTDAVQAQSSSPASQVDLTGEGNASQGTVFISSTAAAITYATTVAGEGGAPEYDLHITVERIT
ncbi:hypothetical protein LCGC14_1972760 [marine sediment metagenome]|uniref:Uncharacterized protein n=1 Tax=marine sediment metagenome TaxID=412755 RepID=A0A0F9HPL6_9ZZZZ